MISLDELHTVPTVRVEDGHAIIRLPQRLVDSLRAEMAACPCRAAKSRDTEAIRMWFLSLLACKLPIDQILSVRLPLAEVHGLRVALADCPCRARVVSGVVTARQRLAKALGRLTVR